jgi:hypothetical protein
VKCSKVNNTNLSSDTRNKSIDPQKLPALEQHNGKT